MSNLMSRELARKLTERIVGWLTPTLDTMVEAGILKRRCAVITVLDPTIPYHPDVDVESVVLAQVIWGDRDHPEVGRFTAISLKKAEITWRTGRPSREVQALHPHLLKETDTVWGGSVVLDDLIVACSGVQDYFDEMIAMMIAAMTKGLLTYHRQEVMKDNPADFYDVAVRSWQERWTDLSPSGDGGGLPLITTHG